MSARVLLVVAVLLVRPGVAPGQSCWLARPSCHTFWITESGPRLGNDEAFFNGHVGSATAVGVMVNHSGVWALGGAVELTTGSESGLYRLTLMPRYRRWLGPQVGLDLGAGVAILGENEPAAGFKGLTALAALAVGPWVTLAAQVETRSDYATGTETAGSVGVRFGGYAGPIAALATLVLGFFGAAGAD